MPLSCRTLWLSDIHLGNGASRAPELLQFLDRVRADRIYLVGDIVDLQYMKVKPGFAESHRSVVSRLMQLAHTGTEIIYIPGNHDHEFRSLAGRSLCGIQIALEATHRTADGLRLLITHGDVLDGAVRKGTNLEQFGAAAYGVILRLDSLFNDVRRRFGRDHLSLSRRVKERLAAANEYMRRFEEVAAGYATDRGFDGIVCGHIHRPGIRRIGATLYANDGDWVEHRTALLELENGELQLVCWRGRTVNIESSSQPSPVAA